MICSCKYCTRQVINIFTEEDECICNNFDCQFYGDECHACDDGHCADYLPDEYEIDEDLPF